MIRPSFTLDATPSPCRCEAMPIAPRLDAGEFIVDDDDDDQFETQVRSAVARETAGRRQLSQPAWSGTAKRRSRDATSSECIMRGSF